MDPLVAARALAAHGVPLFLAKPAPPEKLKSKNHASGFILPQRWQLSEAGAASIDVVDRWKPGMALCAVTGGALDVLDVDPRNGGLGSYERLTEAGAWPTVLARQRTPGGGHHDFIAATGVAKRRSNELPGIDLQAGLPDGSGRGFVFLAPTTRPELVKPDGTIRPAGTYIWEQEPDLVALSKLIKSCETEEGNPETDALLAAFDPPGTNPDSPPEPRERNLSPYTGPAYADMQPWEQSAVDAEWGALIDRWDDLLVQAAEWPEGITDEHGRGWEALSRDCAFELARLARHPAYQATPEQAERLYHELLEGTIDSGAGVLGKWDRAASTEATAPNWAPRLSAKRDAAEEFADEPLPGTLDPLFLDVAAFLSGDLPEPPKRVFAQRTDGQPLFYEGQVNFVFGHPETGKGWLVLLAVAQAIAANQPAVVIDLDHNGPAATLTRLIQVGADPQRLANPALFRYVEPEDDKALDAIVKSCCTWGSDSESPWLAMVDSVGELLPMLGLSSNSPDDFTVAHASVLKPLAMAGACVVAIDHLAKNAESQRLGATGTIAKRRAVGGVSLRVTAKTPFAPGVPGASALTINKDRHGALRAASSTPSPGDEALAAMLVMHPSGAVRLLPPNTAVNHFSEETPLPKYEDTEIKAAVLDVLQRGPVRGLMKLAQETGKRRIALRDICQRMAEEGIILIEEYRPRRGPKGLEYRLPDQIGADDDELL